MRNFRNYDIWIKAVDFSTNIYKLITKFPVKETYALANQLQRASVSISSNIAEGCSRNSELDFVHFLEISIGSCFEIETQILIAKNLEYISLDDYETLANDLINIETQINKLITTIRNNKKVNKANG